MAANFLRGRAWRAGHALVAGAKTSKLTKKHVMVFRMIAAEWEEN